MRYPHLYLILLLISCSNFKTNNFQKIEYASFDVNSYRTEKKDSVYIDLYFTISDNGLIEINDTDDYHEKHTYYSFQITDDQMKRMNSVFTQAKRLKSYLADTTMEENSFYAGSYHFYRVTYSNGTVDSICIIPPFMSKEFEGIYNFLDSILYVREDRHEIKQFGIPTLFKISLKDCYQSSNYLPQIKNPPPFRLEDQPK